MHDGNLELLTLTYLNHRPPGCPAIGWPAFDQAGTRRVINGTQHNIQFWDRRRLRAELATLQLDWSAPPLLPPPATAAEHIKGVLTLPSLPSLLKRTLPILPSDLGQGVLGAGTNLIVGNQLPASFGAWGRNGFGRQR